MRYLRGSSSVCLQSGRTREVEIELRGTIIMIMLEISIRGDPLQDTCSLLEIVYWFESYSLVYNNFVNYKDKVHDGFRSL